MDKERGVGGSTVPPSLLPALATLLHWAQLREARVRSRKEGRALANLFKKGEVAPAAPPAHIYPQRQSPSLIPTGKDHPGEVHQLLLGKGWRAGKGVEGERACPCWRGLGALLLLTSKGS